MILKRLQQTLQSVDHIERCELARLFNLSADGIDAMLAVWIARGRVKRSVVTCCSDCQQCREKSSQVIFEWCEPTE